VLWLRSVLMSIRDANVLVFNLILCSFYFSHVVKNTRTLMCNMEIIMKDVKVNSTSRPYDKDKYAESLSESHRKFTSSEARGECTFAWCSRQAYYVSRSGKPACKGCFEHKEKMRLCAEYNKPAPRLLSPDQMEAVANLVQCHLDDELDGFVERLIDKLRVL